MQKNLYSEGVRLRTYPYTMARTAAMRALLLKKEEYPRLLKMSLNEITAYLQSSEYKKEIDELAACFSGTDLVEMAVEKNLLRTFEKLRRISEGSLRLLIEEYLKRKDIWNIKTILRGKLANEPVNNIRAMITPAGTLSMDFFERLIKKESIELARGELDELKIPGLGNAFDYYAKEKNISEIENTLDHYYYAGLLEFAKKLPKHGTLFREFLQSEIYVLNILTLLRLKREGVAASTIKKYLFFSGYGNSMKLRELLDAEDVAALFKKLEKTKYWPVIKGGFDAFGRDKSLIDVEVRLYNYLLKKTLLLHHQHPLSVDVILGFMFAKEIEARNIKTIIKGKELGLREEFIQSQLVV